MLVDGSSYLYRAFHAMSQSDLRNSRGEPTGAIYGVLNMLRRLHKDYAADYSACIFDAKGKTFRDDAYPEYKANRPPMPDDLACQIAPLHEAIRAMGWPLLMIDGVEADDVIGTLAVAASQRGMRTIISTGDKDIAQLVNAQVTLVNTMTNETLDIPGVEKKFGVPPERIVDYLALIGDTVDNVPGVPKCGPKTAVKWLTQYQTLDNVMAHAADISGVVGENLRKTLEWLPKARELLTIKCDVVLPATIDALSHEKHDEAKLAELYARFDFKTWLRELQGGGAAVEPPRSSADRSGDDAAPLPMATAAPVAAVMTRAYETVLTAEQLDAWLQKINAATLTAVDTETTSLEPLRARLVGISLAVEAGHAAYIPLDHRYAGAPQQLGVEAVLAKMKPWLENAAALKLGQNLKYDTHIFANHGVHLAGIQHDTLLQSYVLESHRSHDMDSLAERHLGVKTISFEEVAGKGAKQICFDQVSIETAAEYAAEDADITLQLHHALAGQPFILNSPKQIQEILFVKQGIKPVKKTPTGAPSTDEDALEQLAQDHPLPKLLLEYRGIAKLKSTYTDKLPRMVNPDTGRVHTNYAQAVAITGRLASNDPNLQNIPVRNAEGRRIREAFIAPPGSHIVSADYSQIELRIMAHISRDASLLKAFAAGEDIHRATAAEIFGAELDAVDNEQRRYAKVINFGLIYGMSAFGLAGQLGIERAAAQQYMDRYFARYPGVAEYMRTTREQARASGYVETVFGRRLWLPEIKSSNGARRQGAERAAINAPMQGTAADLIKMAMIAVQGWLEQGHHQSKLIMQVHDELVLEVPDAELTLIQSELPGLMCSVAALAVPLVVTVGVGANWDKAH